MHEHIARVLYYIEVHLFFATLVCLAAWALTSSRHASATVKYWIWVATVLNFILPVGASIDRLFATHLTSATPIGFLGGIGADLARSVPLILGVCAIWLAGSLALGARLLLRLQVEQRAECPPNREPDGGARRLTPASAFVPATVPVRYASQGSAPAVEGLVQPYILLPDGIERILTEGELRAVMLHELAHARRRDNLIRLMYEVVRCVLWFHPFVWFAGWRLALYRELSCDEPVIRAARGSDLVSALTKLAMPNEEPLLRAPASAFISDRVVQLMSTPTTRPAAATSALILTAYCAVLAGGAAETIMHTACCFIARL